MTEIVLKETPRARLPLGIGILASAVLAGVAWVRIGPVLAAIIVVAAVVQLVVAGRLNRVGLVTHGDQLTVTNGWARYVVDRGDIAAFEMAKRWRFGSPRPVLRRRDGEKVLLETVARRGNLAAMERELAVLDAWREA